MFKKIALLLWGLGVVMALGACEKVEETHKESIEDKLITSFDHKSGDIQRKVAEIVQNAKNNDYKAALNELALLSATHRLTTKQKLAIDTLVRQLRYDMEEEIFSKQDDQPDE